MKKSIKPRKVGALSWLIGLVLVGALLIGMFSFGRSSWFARIPGVSITAREWRLYNGLFDRHPARASAPMPLFRFGGSREVATCLEDQHGGAWRSRWFEADGYGDSVDVRNLLDRQGVVLRFKQTALYKAQRRVMLTPVDPSTLHAKRLEILAKELGALTPATTLVRVLSCGKDLGPHVQREWLDERFLEQRGVRGGSLVKMGMDPSRPDQQFAVIDADSAEQGKLRGIIERALAEVAGGNTDMLAGLVDERAALTWALMAWVDGRDLREAPVTFIYNWSTAKFSPIYEVPRLSANANPAEPVLLNLLTPLFQRPSFRARFQEQQARVASEWPQLQQRIATMDAAWSLALGGTPDAEGSVVPGRSRWNLAHIADSRAMEVLQRVAVAGPGHATLLHGMELPPVVVGSVEDTALLKGIAKRYKLILQGDSIIFPRGKYQIDEDLEFPAGKAVLMLQGARIFMAQGRSILCKGDLYIRGTLRNPVFIRPQEDHQHFGAIAVLGGSSQQCAISGLYISGGAGAKLAGMRCAGMLTVYGASRTNIGTTVFQENTAEASLFVDGGELEMSEVRFEDAAKSFVRLDHGRAVLRELTMVGARANTTTGIMVGGGTAAILGGTYTNLKETAIHADGAAQVLVRNVRLSQNGTAVQSTSRAEVHVEGCVIDDNEVAFGTGPDADGDRLIIYPNRLTGNKQDRRGDAGFKERPALDASTVSLFGVALNEPQAKGTGRTARSRGGRSAN